MKNTKIQWTETTWNPVRGCSRVSKGCEHCYAETVAHRFSGPGQPYEGLTVVNQSTGEPRWNGKVTLVEEHLLDPLRWQKPRMIFVNSMSDVFHEAIPDEYIDRMFAAMALAPRHTFQILTKRPERMRAYFAAEDRDLAISRAKDVILEIRKFSFAEPRRKYLSGLPNLPLPNVWLGVSVEDQQTADDRIPLLLQTPAVIRWISAEPLLGAVNLTRLDYERTCTVDAVNGKHGVAEPLQGSSANLDWVVVGGESGSKARPFNVAWAHSIVQQCREANVACFVKQLGANAFGPSEGCKCGNDPHRLTFSDRKGGDIEEWPEDLRVREYPSTQTQAI